MGCCLSLHCNVHALKQASLACILQYTSLQPTVLPAGVISSCNLWLSFTDYLCMHQGNGNAAAWNIKNCNGWLATQCVPWTMSPFVAQRTESSSGIPWAAQFILNRNALRGLPSSYTHRAIRQQTALLHNPNTGRSHWLGLICFPRVSCRNLWLWMLPDMWLSEQLHLRPHHWDLLLQPRMEGSTMWPR